MPSAPTSVALALAALALLAAPEAGAIPGAPRCVIDIGDFTAAQPAPGVDLGRVAREALAATLSRDATVVLAGAAPPAANARAAARGYIVDGRVRVVDIATATRVEVSLIVQTAPGREYRFESAASVTLSGGASAQRGRGVADATRRAVTTAASRLLGEMTGG